MSIARLHRNPDKSNSSRSGFFRSLDCESRPLTESGAPLTPAEDFEGAPLSERGERLSFDFRILLDQRHSGMTPSPNPFKRGASRKPSPAPSIESRLP